MKFAASATQLERFRSAVACTLGLHIDPDRLPVLAELLEARRETGAGALPAFDDPRELRQLTRALCVSETYFMRNADQFRALAALLLARAQSGARHVRLLSAGCSSGEEAYSLAIVLRETLPHIDDWNVSILAVDVNAHALERAREARYSPWSVRETPKSLLEKYFTKSGAQYRLSDAVRSMVRLEHCNLADSSSALWQPEAFDIIFCRNVLMYFTRDAMRSVVEHMARALPPGGYLFLGHAENLRGVSHSFRLKHSHETFYYERKSVLEVYEPAQTELEREEPDASVASDTAPWYEAIQRASTRIAHLSHEASDGKRADAPRSRPSADPSRMESRSLLAEAMALLAQERPQEALLRLDSAASGDSDMDVEWLLLRAVLLVNQGDSVNAERVCEKLLRLDDLHAGAHFVLALCREHAGDPDQAIHYSHMACYLDSEFAMPHLQLGRLARRAGELQTARRELRAARALLPYESPTKLVLFGGGFDRHALMQLCSGELKACGEGT